MYISAYVISGQTCTDLENGWYEFGSSMNDILSGHLRHLEVGVPAEGEGHAVSSAMQHTYMFTGIYFCKSLRLLEISVFLSLFSRYYIFLSR